VLAQRVLEAVFGDEAVRRLTHEAHMSLAARTDALLDEESSRFTRQLDATGAASRDGDDLRATAGRVQAAMSTRTAAAAWGAGELPAGGGGHLRGTGAVARSAEVVVPEQPEHTHWWSRWWRGTT